MFRNQTFKILSNLILVLATSLIRQVFWGFKTGFSLADGPPPFADTPVNTPSLGIASFTSSQIHFAFIFW